MKIAFKILSAAVLAMSLAACSGAADPAATDADLTEAEATVARGDFQRALEIANDMTSSADTASYNVGQYFRLACVYAEVADNIPDNEAVMASAVNALNHALALNPDSVAVLVNGLDVDATAALHTPLQLIGNANSDSIPTDHDIDPADSLSLHVHDHE